MRKYLYAAVITLPKLFDRCGFGVLGFVADSED